MVVGLEREREVGASVSYRCLHALAALRFLAEDHGRPDDAFGGQNAIGEHVEHAHVFVFLDCRVK